MPLFFSFSFHFFSISLLSFFSIISSSLHFSLFLISLLLFGLFLSSCPLVSSSLMACISSPPLPISFPFSPLLSYFFLSISISHLPFLHLSPYPALLLFISCFSFFSSSSLLTSHLFLSSSPLPSSPPTLFLYDSLTKITHIILQ